MKRMTSLLLAAPVVFFMVVATERRAWGYIDPGTGLVALQSVASVAAACSYFFRRRILSRFGIRLGVAKEKTAVRVPVEAVAEPGTPRNVA
jgi:hypothetical protein